MISVSDVRDSFSGDTKQKNHTYVRDGRSWIYSSVVEAGDVDLSVCSNACFLLDVLNFRCPALWKKENRRPHYFIPATCLRLAQKMDDGYLWTTKLYRIASFGLLYKEYNFMERTLIQVMGVASFYVHSPHTVIDQNTKILDAFPDTVSDYAHAYVRMWLISGSTCSMLTELTGSIALAAIACAASVKTSVPVLEQITELIQLGFCGDYSLEQCRKCARDEIKQNSESIHMNTPPPLKRRRVEVSKQERNNWSPIAYSNLNEPLESAACSHSTPKNQ
jgi:hypothetical protein